MRVFSLGSVSLLLFASVFAQGPADTPMPKKVRDNYNEGLKAVQQREPSIALVYFRKADKEAGGHCLPCHEQIVQIGLSQGDWKAVQDGASAMTTEVKEPKQQAIAHYYVGVAAMNQGNNKRDDSLLARAHDEFTQATTLYPNFPQIVFDDGKTLAQLHRDDEAKAQFQKFIAMTPEGQFKRERALQFIKKPELARANLVPEFGIITTSGEGLDAIGIQGNVVLVYFWATTCGTCPRVLPRLRDLAKKFQNQPLIVLGVSADYDERAWKSFMEKNDMPGLQYRDGFDGPMAHAFGVRINWHSNVDQPITRTWQTSYGMKEDLPKVFLVDSDGVVETTKISESLDSQVQQLLGRADQDKAQK